MWSHTVPHEAPVPSGWGGGCRARSTPKCTAFRHQSPLLSTCSQTPQLYMILKVQDHSFQNHIGLMGLRDSGSEWYPLWHGPYHHLRVGAKTRVWGRVVRRRQGSRNLRPCNIKKLADRWILDVKDT